MDRRTTRGVRLYASSLTTIASKLAPTGGVKVEISGSAPFIQVIGAFVRKKECFSTTPRHNARRDESI